MTTSDLVQVMEFGYSDYLLLPDDPIDWTGDLRRDLTPADNRRRILDRCHADGVTPGEDGWLTWFDDVGTWRDDDGVVHGCRQWTRIRWEHPDIQDLI